MGGMSIGMETSEPEHDALELRVALSVSIASRTDESPSEGAI